MILGIIRQSLKNIMGIIPKYESGYGLNRGRHVSMTLHLYWAWEVPIQNHEKRGNNLYYDYVE